ncbi:Mitochondrial inner membrane protein isoform 2 [Schistosoma japonicum]|uniref:Mitochondrial inner membrane protein isoform 2 n=2 Tax=Schistosoma japonicum TaxID=6182 RepID=A0A4Z2DRK3_SCHJA|nr:Membrane insertion protein OxaA YidC [Schistosoma japonicum]TNN19079.1 Mitochondrial inner membrane protein isoform 2 [Schistosoma japonicum]
MLKSQVTRFQQYSYSTSALCYISNELFHPDHMHVKAITNLLLGIHDHLKFPWGITIATTAVLVRTAIAVPLYIYAEKNNAKVSHIAIDCQKNRHLVKTKLLNSEYYRKCTPNGQIILENRLFRRVFIKKCEENGCHPLKSSTVGIIQLPLWLTFTFSLRYLSGFQLSTHDFSHLIDNPSFNVPCSSLLLPFLCTLAGLVNVELAFLRRPLFIDPKSNSVIPDPMFNKLVRFAGWFGNVVLLACSTFVPKVG